MRQITKFVSDDGLEFSDEQRCRAYEATCEQVKRIMSPLIERPNLPSCAFENGAGYIQHDPAVARLVRKQILTLARENVSHGWIEQAINDESVHSSYPGRIIGESDVKCLRDAWGRFQCMDKQWREYGQPYYAENPESAQDVCLNDVASTL